MSGKANVHLYTVKREGGFCDVLGHSALRSLRPQITQEPDQEPESLNTFCISGLQHDTTKNISGFWPMTKMDLLLYGLL